MSNETYLLTTLMSAAIGRSPEPDLSEAGTSWADFLTALAEITHADTAKMYLIENGQPVACWQVGEDWAGPDISESGQMRTSRVYSQFDLPSGLGAEATLCPLRAIRWRIAQNSWGVLLLRRRDEDFRAIDGQHLSNLLPYLAPAVQGWQRLRQERAHGVLAHRVSAGLGAGWILFSRSGQVASMAPGLAGRLEALAGIRLSAEGWLLFPASHAGGLREALSALTAGETGPQILWLSTAPPVQMVLSVEEYAGFPEVVGRVRHEVTASHLPLTWIMSAFHLNRSEARLAVALCDGLSLSEAAGQLGWTVETARSNSKRLFARMGVSGQADVVRALLRSAVWLGPDPGVA
ncbi:helix-turn-helix transcriptional regulator [Celeribacter sp. SCSIO 80788]|uniref:helix-turn-helix transcriptional regulator n=1 Tax=Celeribacter sp. SCSIO 80788 TaxID=3117013 RepID=UPI003DA25CC2